ncbi:MAG: HAD family phosphatase [Cyclobacteriaceae bacterium]|nr:HAD family phosphatase [Cyclobacteriaceae bacterium]
MKGSLLPYKNLVFDLGGVIIDLAIERTIDAISRLSGLTEAAIRKAYMHQPEFLAYEKGLITDDEFRNALQHIFSFKATVAVTDACWNAMLAGLPKQKLELLEKLGEHYHLTVLSNTNSIHLHHVNSAMLPAVSAHTSLNAYFNRHYYSHLVNKRKPEKEIFMQVLEESEFKPADTLFLDDNPENIAAAEVLGIHTRLITHPDNVYELFAAHE